MSRACIPASFISFSSPLPLFYSQKTKKKHEKSPKKINHRPSKRDLIDRGVKAREREDDRERFKGDKIEVPFKINRIRRFAIIYRERKKEKPFAKQIPGYIFKKCVKKNGNQKEHGREKESGKLRGELQKSRRRTGS